MLFDKCLALVFSLMILGQAYLVRRCVGTWLFPACLFGLFWFALTFVPLVVLPTVPISLWGTGFILCCLVAFSCSAFPFLWSKAFRENTTKRKSSPLVNGSPFLMKTFYVLSLATLVCILMDSFAQGFSLHDLIFDLIATAASYRNLGTFGDLNVTVYGRLGEILVYDVAIVGGMLISWMPTKWKRFRVILFSFAPGVLFAVAQSTKWALFSCIAFFYAGVLVYRIGQSDFRLFKEGVLKKVVICIAMLVPITTVSFMSRGLQDTDDSTLVHDRLKLLFASYSSGHLYGFSDWCTFYMAERWDTGQHSEIQYAKEHPTYGLYTFAPLFRFFGSGGTLPDDDYEFGDVLIGNIYTVFRGLIVDFGLGGCLLFMFLIGLLNHWSFYGMLVNRRPVLTVAAFVFFIGFFYASFGRSLFSWSGIYFTFALLWVVLQVNKWITEADGRRLALATEATERP